MMLSLLLSHSRDTLSDNSGKQEKAFLNQMNTTIVQRHDGQRHQRQRLLPTLKPRIQCQKVIMWN